MWLSGIGIGSHRRACGKTKVQKPLDHVKLDRPERERLLDIGRAAGDLYSAKDAMFTELLADERFEHLDPVVVSDYAYAAAKFCFPAETKY